ncbi:MAG TPA: helix-turn-helix domain-containing protein [Candidatus Rothia avistercoris]|uniref:Helix-turn-helix domain-containing protein n=1 Tax=Candidatus Rothia avistercoris TaxID=2840479 RepID=A0A9D2UF19_9MICC|nr:helix-turn-helix domain-containing protein [Candidatus Rothia avistercoris]
MSTYAERVSRALKQSKLSQRHLEQVSGISQSTISRIVSGRRTPTVPELLSLAKALGVSFASLAEVEQASDRALFAARASGNSNMSEMQDALNSYLNLSAFLDDQVIF